MDRALLGDDDGAALVNSSRPFHPPLALAQQRAVSGATSGPGSTGSVAAIRAQVAAEDAAHEKEAAANLARGRQLLAEGKSGVAKIYLQNAARHSSGEIRQQALAALQLIEQGKSSGKVAGQ